jgi:hypothetical protein
MHLLLQGHDKWLLKHVFILKSSPSYVSADVLHVLNSKLKTVRFPHDFNRRPSNIELMSKWKSSEIKIFCFYVAIPLFVNHIPSIYFCSFAIYVFATRLLYEPATVANVNLAKEMLDNYHANLEKIYGDYAYDFTVHGLTHLASQVLKHGPLKTHSNFVFEVSLCFFWEIMLSF